MEKPQFIHPSENGGESSFPQKTDWSDLDVRSEDVQEIIGRPPHWLVRWGIAIFFAVLAVVFLSASVIKYPEVITAPLRVTAIEAPQTLESRVSGKLIRILNENNSYVEQGDMLAWMESTANHEQVLRLSNLMDSVRLSLLSAETEYFRDMDLSEFNNLGELQSAFQGFEQSWREFQLYLPNGFYVQQRQILEQELEYTQQLLDGLLDQKQIREVDYELAQREFDIQKQLAEDGFISSIDLMRAESDFSASRLTLQQIESSIINNHVSRSAKEKELMDLDRRMDEQRIVFLQSLNIMKSAIDEWKRNYLLIAPFAGKVVYIGIIQENQSVNAGQEIFYIQPDNSQFFGEMAISQQSFGKIEVGQQVMVRFSGYPYQEYGSVYGLVDYFSDFPVRDSLFFAKVSFPDGLKTSYGQQIPPRNGMTGQAEIITQDMRLLDRVYNNITKELR